MRIIDSPFLAFHNTFRHSNINVTRHSANQSIAQDIEGAFGCMDPSGTFVYVPNFFPDIPIQVRLRGIINEEKMFFIGQIVDQGNL